MGSRFGIALAVCLWGASSAFSQVVHFETTVGGFDMVLNPTDNPVLQEHVDNMLFYVKNGNYKGSWVDRAATGFVLQMGQFFSNTKRPPLTSDSVRRVAVVDPVPGEPAIENAGLSNTIGTVSLALLGAPNNRAQQDSGTSSFFINVGDNSRLDEDFTVFAVIPDMTVVNKIIALDPIDRADEPLFSAEPDGRTFLNVPITADGFQVFIKSASIVTDSMSIAQATAGVNSILAKSAAAFNGATSSALGSGELAASPIEISAVSTSETVGGGASAALSTGGAVPEPDAILLALIGLFAAVTRRRAAR